MHLSYSTQQTPTHTYPLSLHDDLPIYLQRSVAGRRIDLAAVSAGPHRRETELAFVELLGPSHVADRDRRLQPVAAQSHRSDRKSTRLNSSHLVNSYSVFCFKKTKKDRL